MKFNVIFFDLDDTLYPSHVGLWNAIKERMNDYMSRRMNIPVEEIPALREKYYLQYGTTLHGLRMRHKVDVQDFLAYVHDLPLANYLTPDPALRSVIASLPARKLIFTNADVPHAERVLAALNLRDLFSAIVDINAIDPYCKPMPESFEIAMKIAGESDPARCVMIDDLPRTTRAAKRAGWSGVLYGGTAVNG
ncbi:MAG: pyrimidine 5'-nucleotidase, partial [Chloroflexi bacterium]|nr:pyrimidine 5'-nucleotidase [Chloroflexota bacterium]